MARFRGNVHAGSDRAAATVLFLVLLVALLLAAWWILSPESFTAAVDNVTRGANR